ncbi:MAG: hypothetical protein M3T96_08850, partial [Acidobacteriota bacterium]|nr:hypothetical protein [Acidobacteriota bacterium]
TLTSPNGRSYTEIASEEGAGYKKPYIARAEALLAWDWNDVDGNYTTVSRHYSECPIANFGTTSVASLVVLHAYEREEPSGDYIPTCDSSCTIYPRYRNVGVTAPYIQCGSIKNPLTGCGLGLCVDKQVRGRCRG